MVSRFHRSYFIIFQMWRSGFVYLLMVTTSKEFVIPDPMAPARKPDMMLYVVSFFLYSSSYPT